MKTAFFIVGCPGGAKEIGRGQSAPRFHGPNSSAFRLPLPGQFRYTIPFPRVAASLHPWLQPVAPTGASGLSKFPLPSSCPSACNTDFRLETGNSSNSLTTQPPFVFHEIANHLNASPETFSIAVHDKSFCRVAVDDKAIRRMYLGWRIDILAVGLAPLRICIESTKAVGSRLVGAGSDSKSAASLWPRAPGCGLNVKINQVKVFGVSSSQAISFLVSRTFAGMLAASHNLVTNESERK